MHKFKSFITESKDTKSQIEDILDKEMRVSDGPLGSAGYAEYVKDINGEEAVTKTNKGYNIFVEWQADDKNDATKVAKTVNKRLEKLLGVKVKVNVYSDIWGVDKNAWYVTIDNEVVLPV